MSRTLRNHACWRNLKVGRSCLITLKGFCDGTSDVPRRQEVSNAEWSRNGRMDQRIAFRRKGSVSWS